MDGEHVRGAGDVVKGAVNDTAGELTADKGLQAQGKFDKARSSARATLGDANVAAIIFRVS
jgi:uncharacterized protein YjbJ (UPF0337 family)